MVFHWSVPVAHQRGRAASAAVRTPTTVAAHVEHIVAELGVARRAQIAAWVATQG